MLTIYVLNLWVFFACHADDACSLDYSILFDVFVFFDRLAEFRWLNISVHLKQWFVWNIYIVYGKCCMCVVYVWQHKCTKCIGSLGKHLTISIGNVSSNDVPELWFGDVRLRNDSSVRRGEFYSVKTAFVRYTPCVQNFLQHCIRYMESRTKQKLSLVHLL